jgi:hypothetical protein
VLPSLKTPVAVNAVVMPRATVGVAGVTSRLSSSAVVTVRVALPAWAPSVAVMVAAPMFSARAWPGAPGSRPATVGSELDQVACEVMSFLLPSLKKPVAWKVALVPRAALAVEGETSMRTRVASVTVTAALARSVSSAAVMLAPPLARATTRPLSAPALVTKAMALALLDQSTALVTSSVDWSLSTAVAVKRSDNPMGRVVTEGCTSRRCTVAAVTVTSMVVRTPWYDTVSVVRPAVLPSSRAPCTSHTELSAGVNSAEAVTFSTRRSV